MISFSRYGDLMEMSLSDIRSNMIDAINDANDKDLVTMYRAMESSVEKRLVRNKAVALYKDRGLGDFIDRPPFDEFVKKVLAAKATTEDKVEFMDGLLAGSYLKSGSFLKAKSGNLKSMIDTSNVVMKQLVSWMFKWAPQIDANSTVAVGSAEALLILLAKGGGKGDPFGDVKIGSTIIEMKAGGGALGKDGPKYWGDRKESFAKAVKAALPGLTSKSTNELARMNPLSYTKQKDKSIALSELSLMMSAAGKSDAEIATFWKRFIDGALGTKLPGKIKVSRGVCDYNSWMRYATAAAFDVYKKQTKFDMLTLLDVQTGDFLNFVSGGDMLASDQWHFDQSLIWTGGGQGKSLSPRIYFGSRTFPTIQSNDHIKAIDTQYKAVKAVADAIAKRSRNADKLVKSLRMDPNVEHQIKITSQIRSAEVKKILMMKSAKEIESYWKKVSKK